MLSKDELHLLLDANNIKPPMHEKWTTPKKMSSYRCNEVGWWIAENKPKDYIIIDDPWSGTYLEDWELEGKLKNLILVNPEVGLTGEHYTQMAEIVKTW